MPSIVTGTSMTVRLDVLCIGTELRMCRLRTQSAACADVPHNSNASIVDKRTRAAITFLTGAS